MLPSYAPKVGDTAYCARCGRRYSICSHVNCPVTWDSDHAVRIAARYALGRHNNPDHDTTSYTDPGWDREEPPTLR